MKILLKLALLLPLSLAAQSVDAVQSFKITPLRPVEELRKAAPQLKTQRSRNERIAVLKRTGDALIAEFADLARSAPSYREKPSLWTIRASILNRLQELDLRG